MTYRVKIEDEDEIGNVQNWSIVGNTLVLYFPNGTILGRTGWLDFEIRDEDES